MEEEALQKVEEASELYKVCVTNVEERRNDLENTKREILTQLRTLVFQCDLTLKAVTVNLFNMQHLQAASLQTVYSLSVIVPNSMTQAKSTVNLSRPQIQLKKTKLMEM